MSLTLIPATEFPQPAIKETATSLWSSAVVTYDKDAMFGIHHWPPLRRLYYCSKQIKRKQKEDVYNPLKIVSIQQLEIEEQYGYTYMKNVVVQREDEKEYTFNETDSWNLSLNDIEDMYLLKVQNKLLHFPKSTQYAFVTSLLIIIRSVII